MRVSVVIPAHNEEANIRPLAEAVLLLFSKRAIDGEIIIVDDNSTDSTPKITDSLARQHKSICAIHRKASPGMGNALKEGTKKAEGKYVAWIMGDRSDKLETIPVMLRKLDSGYDIVFGSRYIAGGSSGNLDKFKAFSSSGYTRLAQLVFGFKAHDITNAFRAFRKEVFDSIELESSDFAISPEFAIKAHLKGYRLGEVPTTYTNRISGKTKFKMFKMGVRYVSLLKYKLEGYKTDKCD